MSDIDVLRACQNVLRMVHELHLRGYQLIRIAPGLSPSGTSWRCSVAPASNICREHGARLSSWNRVAAHYTAGAGRSYFGWTDAAHATPSQLAERFIERFPEIAAAGRGRDWLYAGWYVEMLGLTYPAAFPIAYADYDTPEGCLTTVGPGKSLRISMPPPGLAGTGD